MSKYRETISREEFERIERYLLGNMDGAEQTEFERLLQADDLLREEVHLQGQLTGAVEVGIFKMGGTTKPKKQTIPTGRKLRDYWHYMAAALVVGLGLAGWWFLGQPSKTHSELYTSYFKPDLGLPVVMGSDSTKYLFNEGMVSYKEGHYEDAIGIWEALISEKGVSDTLTYYIGVAHLNMEHPIDASGYLTTISENDHSVFREKALWYLALLKINKKEYTVARRLLMQLPEKKEAVELLQKIND